MACSSRSSCYGTRIEEDGPFFRVGGHQDLLMCPGVVRVDPAGLVSAVDIQNCQRAGAFGTERADQQDYSAVEKIVDKVRVLVPKGLFTHAFVWFPTWTWAQEESDSLFHAGISPQRREDHKKLMATFVFPVPLWLRRTEFVARRDADQKRPLRRALKSKNHGSGGG